MKTKKLIVMVTVLVFIFSFTSIAYAGTDNVSADGVPLADQTSDGIIGGEDVDESEVLPPSDEEYVVDSYVGPIPALETDIAAHTVGVQTVIFQKTSSKRASFNISITSTTNVTKLVVKVELYKKQGDSYKSTGKVETLRQSGNTLAGKVIFAVTATGKYKAKATVIEYMGTAQLTNSPIFYTLNSNGF